MLWIRTGQGPDFFTGYPQGRVNFARAARRAGKLFRPREASLRTRALAAPWVAILDRRLSVQRRSRSFEPAPVRTKILCCGWWRNHPRCTASNTPIRICSEERLRFCRGARSQPSRVTTVPEDRLCRHAGDTHDCRTSRLRDLLLEIHTGVRLVSRVIRFWLGDSA